MSMMRRQSVTIKQQTVTSQDSYGQDVFTWTTFWTGFLEIKAMSGREFWGAQQRWAEARFKCSGLFVSGVTREMRIYWGDRVLNILDVEDPTGKRHHAVMYCKELTD